jgi:hypothetical protein
MKFVVFLVLTALLATAAPQQPAPAESAQKQDTQTWSGLLVDAACKSKDAAMSCEATDRTQSFGLQTSDGKLIKFDASGNTKARTAFRSAGKKGAVSATVKGTMSGDVVRVESVDIT